MLQQNRDRVWQTEAKNEETKQLIKNIKRLTRLKYTAEDKIRIVLEGFRHDIPIRDLCLRELIQPGTYYVWFKDSTEVVRDRLTQDATRDATKAEIQDKNVKMPP